MNGRVRGEVVTQCQLVAGDRFEEQERKVLRAIRRGSGPIATRMNEVILNDLEACEPFLANRLLETGTLRAGNTRRPGDGLHTVHPNGKVQHSIGKELTTELRVLKEQSPQRAQ